MKHLILAVSKNYFSSTFKDEECREFFPSPEKSRFPSYVIADLLRRNIVLMNKFLVFIAKMGFTGQVNGKPVW